MDCEKMCRYSLKTLLLVIFSFSGLAIGLTHPSEFWAVTWVTLTVVILSAITVCAFISRNANKMRASAFALAGWIYLLITFGPFKPELSDSLATTVILEMLYDRALATEAPLHLEPFQHAMQPPPAFEQNRIWFMRIGQSAVTCITGLASLLLCDIINRRRHS
jgi:hypothetical protein